MRYGIALVLIWLLGACADPTVTPTLPGDEGVGDRQDVLVVTNRARDDRGHFGGNRSREVAYLDTAISIPRDRKMGSLPVSYRHPKPGQHFMFIDTQDMGGRDAFVADVRHELRQLPKDQRDILIFVHGYNNSFSDGVFRTAQLMHDFEMNGIALHFSWPSAAHPLGYSHDRDSLLFARDALEQMLRDVDRTGAENVVLVGHSLGTMLVMETLRQMEIAQQGLPDQLLDGVVLIAPDIDIDLFRVQAERVHALPQPFAIFTSAKDQALRLSSRINGRSKRLGTLQDETALAGLDIIQMDVTAFSKGTGNSHFVAGSSPALIALLSRSRDLHQTFALPTRATRGGLPGTVKSVAHVTQVILSPGLLRQ